MTTVKPSAASRSATAAPMPREAPVTIATLLVSFDIFSFLMISWQVRASDGRKLGSFAFRIIRHYLASQSAKGEQYHGPVRRDEGVHAGGGAAKLHARGRGSRPAALHRHRCSQAA